MPLLRLSCAVLALALLISVLYLQGRPDAAQAGAGSAHAPMLHVGDRLAAHEVHVLAEPGRYGLGPQVRDSRYAISRGQLIRFDPATLQVKSILRRQSLLLN